MSFKIALTGNPNSGKTSLFNRLTGAMQKVGNWGGVTVEIKEGSVRYNNDKITVVDLPGTYSLNTYSIEEKVARDFIVEEKPEVVIDVIDATNLERHLYLTVQLLELGIKPVLALNMWDEVEDSGLTIDIKRLKEILGLEIVKTTAKNGKGLKELLDTAAKHIYEYKDSKSEFKVTLPEEIEDAVKLLEKNIKKTEIKKYSARWMAIKLLEKDKDVETILSKEKNFNDIISNRNSLCAKLQKDLGDDAEALIVEARYGYIAGAVRETVQKNPEDRVKLSDKIDTVLTHKLLAYPIFFVFMWVLFQTTFKVGEYPMGWIDSIFNWLHSFVISNMQETPLRDLISEGIIAGVGGVAVFLPNILILFLGISIMEDTGYMARAAFITDRLMHRVGLHGKSFIPMIMGLGCSVPAIMAARTLESEKDRIKTILLTPLIACSARLPVFILFAGALFPKNAANIVFLFQIVFSFGAFLLVALIFKHTLFRNTEEFPFVMELPPYRVPTGRSVLIHMWHKTEHYLKKMGGVVLVFSIILWWAGENPKNPEIELEFNTQKSIVELNQNITDSSKVYRINKLELEKQSMLIEHSYIGKIGKVFEPLAKTFGSDWRGAVSLVTGFVAKEIVVGSMGVLYSVGGDATEENENLREKLKKHFTPLSAFAFMMFLLLYTPCMVALITLIREIKSWKWSVFSVAYQFLFAWGAATFVYQVGKLLGLG